MALAPARAQARERLAQFIAAAAAAEGCQDVAAGVEVGCYNAALAIAQEAAVQRAWDCDDFLRIYEQRVGTVALHLDPQGGVERQFGCARRLARDLCAGRVRPAWVGGARESELCPEGAEAERREVEIREAQKVEVKHSSLYKCPTCGSKRCTYQMVQLRAADELQDVIVTCGDCKRRFRGR